MDKEINDIELNAILYYADYLSMKDISQPVTDNCKYFFIHEVPINSAYILDLEPVYDTENKYFEQAYAEYIIIRNKFGEEGIDSFVENICNLKAAGCVGPELMLKCIHQYSSKQERKQAFNKYNNWKNNQTYTHTTINEDGKYEEKPCSKYFYHYERMLGRQKLAKSV